METTSFAVTKTLFGGLTIGAILDYFGMRGDVIIILSALMLLDYILGITHAVYN
ncbi:MAG: hypothetical protein Q4B28_04995 [bacterium]|nr:hypothetical protein [bacterium]